LANSAIPDEQENAMDEIILRVARTIACMARLRILSALAGAEQVAPTDLARQLGMGLDMVCVHLRHLAAAGLIQRRRSGVWCYGVATSPYGDTAFSGKVARWLFQVLRDPAKALEDCGVGQLCNPPDADPQTALHTLVFESATAFTNLRRLQILRRLGNGEVLAVAALSAELHMSESALSRHVAKLVRRGYLETSRVGRSLAYRLAPTAKTPLHAAFLEFVQAEWTK
jgi:DNA-binding transcriptional ArsR family regulator